jgi:hypothetical protein
MSPSSNQPATGAPQATAAPMGSPKTRRFSDIFKPWKWF